MSVKAVDAIPQELKKPYLKAMKSKGVFWYEMTQLAITFGLRNIEVRELKADSINFDNNTIVLSDSKQVRAYVTKTANKTVLKSWLSEGRKFLRGAIGGELAPLLVRMATTTEQLEALAEEYDLIEPYFVAKNDHYQSHIEQARIEAARTAPKGRIINFSAYPEIKKILKNRSSQYGEMGGYLFPACELSSNRAKGQGFEPISRQSVYRAVKAVEAVLKSASNKFKDILRGVRLGLHSARKTAVQLVASKLDIMAASLWIGHGNGQGDIATTQRYLDRSERRIDEINEKLGALNV